MTDRERPGAGTRHALGRVALAAPGAGGLPSSVLPFPGSPRARRPLLGLASATAGLVALATVGAGVQVAPAPPAATAATTAAAQAAEPDPRPNIVVVVADDMRVDDLRWAPRTRRLVGADGISMENSFAPYPLCCPQRATFLTGQHAHNHGVYWHEPPSGYAAFDDSRTIATSLRAAGYRTGFLGKYLNRYGLDRSRVSGQPSHRYVPAGWDEWRGAVENPGDAGFHGGTYVYTDIAFNHDGKIDNRYRGRYSTQVIGDLAVDMVRRSDRHRQRTGEPFFLLVNHVAPHHGAPRDPDDPQPLGGSEDSTQDFPSPYVPPAERGRFDDVIDRAPGIARSGAPTEMDVSDKPRQVRKLPPLSSADLRAMREVARQRAEAIHVMDRQVARLVASLKRTGEWERTVLVFTSDNGLLQGEHRFRTGKVWSYEPSLRVPLLLTGPGLRGEGPLGHRRYDPVDTPDLTATLLDLAAAEPPRRPDGTSVLPTLLEGDRGWDVPVLTEATHTSRGSERGFGKRSSIGVRTGRWSMTRYRDGFVELYDLLRDPLQHENLARSPEHRDVLAALTASWREVKDCAGADCQAPLPESLAMTADEVADATRRYWKAIERTYGYR